MYEIKDKTIKFKIKNIKKINVLDGCPGISGAKEPKPNKNTSKNSSFVRNIVPTTNIIMPINPKINLKHKKGEGKNYLDVIYQEYKFACITNKTSWWYFRYMIRR